ncbi:SGNH/GDSL hydrolase family protein [Bacillus infantis]|uniref:SGNH/GDSL hydrolase family protein n=1 Tax=Bacillus infantis TaxID=324767 RepID=UPI002002B74E|nr:SGNH/GDSL hydrolase family protein [Bacillus infantis]MCK6206120.1 SGNH/GDSL hydrolase family protein [Bacillus infantis]
MKSKKLLFIGDSITDHGRREDPEQIGFGYVRNLRDYYLTSFPEKEFEFINRGVSGNRVTDLADRWKADVIDIQPDVVSISIGINDVWRQLDSPGIVQIDPGRFKEVYQDLLTQVREETEAEIVLMEPTVIEEDVHSEGNRLLTPYVEAVHELAEQFNAVVVPEHKAFIRYLESGGKLKLTTDAVHMTSAGDMLMARTWVQGAGSLSLFS